MSEATTPANTTDQIATTTAVAPDAQRYGHDEAMADIFDLAHIETEFEGHDPRVTSIAAHIERLEAERDALLATVTAAYFLLNSDQCTHGDGDWHDPACRVCNLRSAFDALPPDVRDRLASMTYAERVIHDE